jgi:DNA-binding CsgD family transcriptional regulator
MTTTDPEPRLAGRDEAIAQVVRAATTATRALVVVTGPAGVGRSSVLQRARHHIAARDITTLTVPVLPSERDKPLALATRIAEHLDAPGLSAAVQRQQHPLVVFLDDLQWADPESLRALGNIPSGTVTFVCAHHTTTTQTLPPLHSVELIRLQPLHHADVTLMLTDLLHAKPVQDMADTLYHGSNGIPAIVRLAIDGYRRAGSLRIVDRNAYLVPISHPPTPAPRHPGFDALRDLGSPTWPVIKALAVLHPLRQQAIPLIATAVGIPAAEVEHILTGLEADELLHSRPWRFRTPLLATCLTACLGPYERHELARLAVSALWEGTTTCEDPRFLPEQLVNAGKLVDNDQAGAVLLAHGSATVVDDEYFAKRWLEAAADRVTEPQQRATALFMHAVTCGYHSDFRSAADSVNTVVTTYADRLPPEALQETQIIRLIALGAMGDHKTLREISDHRWRTLLGDEADQIIGRAVALCFTDRWSEAQALLADTKPIWSLGNNSAITYGNAVGLAATVLCGRPQAYENMLADITTHCPLFAQHRHQPGLLDSMARTLLLLGDATRAEQLFTTHGLPPERRLTGMRALQACAAGHWDEALSHARLSLATGSALGHLLSHTLVCRDMAGILIARGQINAARAVIDSARVTESSLPHLLNIPEADLEYILGNPARARTLVQSGLTSADEHGVVVGADELWLRAALDDLAVGAHADAGDSVTELKRLAEQLGTGRALRNHLLASAVVDRDLHAATTVIALARERDQPHELADTLMILAAHNMGATALLREAYELFGDLDALLPRARLRHLMRTHGIAIPGRSVTISENERLLASLVADGLTNRELATVLAATEKSVEGRLSRLFQRTGYRSRVELATAMLTGEYTPA